MATSNFQYGFRSIRFAMLGALSLAGLVVTGCAHESAGEVGDRLTKQGDYSGAAGAYRSVARDDPRDYEAFYKLGNAYRQGGAILQAIEAYKTALDVMQTSLEGKENVEMRDKILEALGATIAESAIAESEVEALEVQATGKHSAEANYLMAKIARHRGDPDTALDNYNHCLLIDNKNFYVLREYGLYLQHLNQDQKAINTLVRAYRLQATDGEVNSALRQLGIVPGPSLLERSELAEPVVPRGPIPRVDFGKVRSALGLGHGHARPAGSTTPPSALPPAAVSP